MLDKIIMRIEAKISYRRSYCRISSNKLNNNKMYPCKMKNYEIFHILIPKDYHLYFSIYNFDYFCNII